MAALMHIGKLNNTDRKVVVVFPQNPSNAGITVVCDTDALPPRLHDALMDVVQSRDAQQSPVLANVLQRRIFTDTGRDLLNSLHTANALQAQPIHNVTLFPQPNNPIPLAQVVPMPVQDPNMAENVAVQQAQQNAPLTAINEQAQAQAPLTTPTIPAMTPPVIEAPQTMNNVMDATFNPHHNNTLAAENEQMIQTARNILFEAKMLEDEVTRKKEQAYKMAPSLRPTAPAAPAPAAPAPEVVTESVAEEKPKTTRRRSTTAKKKSTTTTRRRTTKKTD